MSARDAEREREIRDALAVLEPLVELGVEDDALDVLRNAALAAVGAMCAQCEAQRGDNDYCVWDGAAHPWVDRHPSS